MRAFRLVFAAALTLSPLPASAVEGPTVAGPIGGSDIRSAVIPPPGVYVGAIGSIGNVLDFVGDNGDPNPALGHARLRRYVGGPFVYYVPDLKVLGGSVALSGIMPMSNHCGRIVPGEREDCRQGVGDPYVELDWSRSFGTLRPSQYEGANPILQGLSVLVGFGVVFPVGSYNDSSLTTQVLSAGNNIWDLAPTVGVTYTTAPILAEGTEVSAKLYWNNYPENRATHYLTSDVVNVDFAVSERIGRWQIGVTGLVGMQFKDDELFGRSIPNTEAFALLLGPVVNYDMPERGVVVRGKVLRTVYAENFVESLNFILGWAKKF